MNDEHWPTDCFKPVAIPGLTMYWNFYGLYVVEVAVTEVSEFHSIKGNRNAPVVEVIRRSDGTVTVFIPTGETFEWRECTTHDLKMLGYSHGGEYSRGGNQSIWIDQPVGHGLLAGDELFFTLDEALKHVRVWRSPAKKRRRFKEIQNRTLEFIKSTHVQAGEPFGCTCKWPKYKMPKIYVRRS
jgi:hypothetical protein